MAAIAFRLLVFVATFYVAVLAVLFVFQSRFIYPAPQQRAAVTPGYEEIVLGTEDGLQLRAFYREAQEGLPTILYFHGNGGTLAGASVSNAASAEAGIGVLLIEYRGYGGNPGEPSEDGLYLDGEAAARWLLARGIEPQRTIVTGNSIGGAVATRTAQFMSESGTPPAALILVAPFTSLPDAASDKLWWLPVRMLVSESYDNAARFAAIGDVPVLIQHGSADTLIADSHGRALAGIAARAEFQLFEGSGHALSFEPRSQAARRDWILALGQR
ncbi:MAG: alpha/beta hydrolase [Erythrobacter sp.]